MKKLTFAILILLISTHCFASSHSIDTRHYVTINFRDHYYGKKVTNVVAHLGILLKTSGYVSANTGDWNGITDIELRPVTSSFGFSEKVILSGYEHLNSGGSTKEEGVIIQYFITLEDGSNAIVGPYRVHFVEKKINWESFYYSPEETSEKFCSAVNAFHNLNINKITTTKVSLETSNNFDSNFPECNN